MPEEKPQAKRSTILERMAGPLEITPPPPKVPIQKA